MHSYLTAPRTSTSTIVNIAHYRCRQSTPPRPASKGRRQLTIVGYSYGLRTTDLHICVIARWRQSRAPRRSETVDLTRIRVRAEAVGQLQTVLNPLHSQDGCAASSAPTATLVTTATVLLRSTCACTIRFRCQGASQLSTLAARLNVRWSQSQGPF